MLSHPNVKMDCVCERQLNACASGESARSVNTIVRFEATISSWLSRETVEQPVAA